LLFRLTAHLRQPQQKLPPVGDRATADRNRLPRAELHRSMSTSSPATASTPGPS